MRITKKEINSEQHSDKKRRAYRSRKVCSSFSSHLDEVRPMKLPASFEKASKEII
nr:MAG TPA: hypothetical protein [Caudoviricetes sp.]DAW85475.1 MAG TPA: hypothetical protein [Bacteriophage sp.]